jgi:hypothetical protein
LPKTPALICQQLSKTPQGLAILEDLWNRLGTVLKTQKDWTADQDQWVFNLLGIPAAFRTADQIGLVIDNTAEFLKSARQLVAQSLEKLRDPEQVAAAQAWDDFCREMALQGTPVTISPEMRLMMRYETMHLRRAHQAMAEFERVRQGGDEPKPEPEKTAPSQAQPQPTAEERTAAFLKAMGSETSAEQAVKDTLQSAQEAAQAAKAAKAASTPSAAAPPAASAAAPKPAAVDLPWGLAYNRKYAQVAQATHQGPYRDPEKERAAKKAQRDACQTPR